MCYCQRAIPTDASVRKLRDAAPATADAQYVVGMYLWTIVSRFEPLEESIVRP